MNYSNIFKAAPAMYKALRNVPIVKMDGGTGLGYECLGCHSVARTDHETMESIHEPCKPDCWVRGVELAIAEAEGYELVDPSPKKGQAT